MDGLDQSVNFRLFELDFYKNKKVLITGHTGFKGTWLAKILICLGAQIIGYALEPHEEAFFYNMTNVGENITSIQGDIRDYEKLKKTFEKVNPEIVIHMAAQAIVKEGYDAPRYTFDTNIMGTVNVLECIRNSKSVKSFINVTTDKVYHNREWDLSYRENDELNGSDPYSNSKSCSELVTAAYRTSYFSERHVGISTVRSGNVIGGGDFAENRIIPDCIRAVVEGRKLIIRNPNSTRPYQHVLEALFAYLMIAQKQFQDNSVQGAYNIGPDNTNVIQTIHLVKKFEEMWGEKLDWQIDDTAKFKEAKLLSLDCSKIKRRFQWQANWDVSCAVKKTIDWVKCWKDKKDIDAFMDNQILEYIKTYNTGVSIDG